MSSVESDFDVRRDRRHLPWQLTAVADITSALNAVSKQLVKEFVTIQGNQLAEVINPILILSFVNTSIIRATSLQLMKETVSGRDLMASKGEPVGPQPQMKKAVDILTKLEKYVDSIFPDVDTSSYFRSERSSDSSKRSYRCVD